MTQCKTSCKGKYLIVRIIEVPNYLKETGFKISVGQEVRVKAHRYTDSTYMISTNRKNSQDKHAHVCVIPTNMTTPIGRADY